LLGDETVESANLSDDTIEYFQDMDLAVLGSPPEQYAQYVKLLQQEYGNIGLPVYRNMRLKVRNSHNSIHFLGQYKFKFLSQILQTFLTIPHIYSTQTFREKFESIARENIKKEIEELKCN
jgi:predicted metal-dependent HD superfamily phosphohydrolase